MPSFDRRWRPALLHERAARTLQISSRNLGPAGKDRDKLSAERLLKEEKKPTNFFALEDRKAGGLRQLYRRLDPCSAIFSPLRARGRTLGVLAVIAAETPRRYDEDDLAFVEEVAQLAALMIDNARLHRDEQDAREGAEATALRMRRKIVENHSPALLWNEVIRRIGL